MEYKEQPRPSILILLKVLFKMIGINKIAQDEYKVKFKNMNFIK